MLWLFESMNKYHLTTFGCQMNKNDSERIVNLLDSLGLQQVSNNLEADIVIVNTCSVRESAEHRIYSLINKWNKIRKHKPQLITAITGCMPGHDKDGKIRKKIKGIDLFFGIEELVMLPKWLKELNPELIKTDIENLTSYLDITPTPVKNSQSFVTIQSGCNNYCTYCIVPYSRGQEKNRKLKDILDEIKMLVRNGSKEITLLGQVVNNYQITDKNNISKDNEFKDGDNFATLLWEVNNIKGVQRVQYTASDPQFFSDDQIKALSLPKMLNYLHLPVQSGDDEILRKMNRKYTVKQYIKLVEKIKRQIPDIAIGTDLIVGFPTETKEQFNNTLKLYEKCQFDITYPAMYSQREGTVAAKSFVDDVSYEEKKARWRKVHSVMEKFAFENNQKYNNKIISVLIDECKNGVCSGRSGEMKFVQVLGDSSLIGKIVDVKVNKADVWVLRGKIVV